MAAVYCPPFVPMALVLPDGLTDGEFTVKHFEMAPGGVEVEKAVKLLATESEWDMVRDLEAGTYVSLEQHVDYPDTNPQGSTLWMTDTPHERRTCLPVVENAKGDVLVAGFGIGMILIPLALNPAVSSITVVELNAQVPAMVLPAIQDYLRRHFRDVTPTPIDVQIADAHSWVPPLKFDTIWLDIWPDINSDNLDSMDALERHYRPALHPGGWMESWSRDKAERMKRAAEGQENAVRYFAESRREAEMRETGVDPMTGWSAERYARRHEILDEFMRAEGKALIAQIEGSKR